MKIEEDIDSALLGEKVKIEACGVVECAKNQEAVVQMIAEDCGIIRVSGDAEDEQKKDKETVTINTTDYAF